MYRMKLIDFHEIQKNHPLLCAPFHVLPRFKMFQILFSDEQFMYVNFFRINILIYSHSIENMLCALEKSPLSTRHDFHSFFHSRSSKAFHRSILPELLLILSSPFLSFSILPFSPAPFKSLGGEKRTLTKKKSATVYDVCPKSTPSSNEILCSKTIFEWQRVWTNALLTMTLIALRHDFPKLGVVERQFFSKKCFYFN